MADRKFIFEVLAKIDDASKNINQLLELLKDAETKDLVIEVALSDDTKKAADTIQDFVDRLNIGEDVSKKLATAINVLATAFGGIATPASNLATTIDSISSSFNFTIEATKNMEKAMRDSFTALSSDTALTSFFANFNQQMVDLSTITKDLSGSLGVVFSQESITKGGDFSEIVRQTTQEMTVLESLARGRLKQSLDEAFKTVTDKSKVIPKEAVAEPLSEAAREAENLANVAQKGAKSVENLTEGIRIPKDEIESLKETAKHIEDISKAHKDIEKAETTPRVDKSLEAQKELLRLMEERVQREKELGLLAEQTNQIARDAKKGVDEITMAERQQLSVLDDQYRRKLDILAEEEKLALSKRSQRGVYGHERKAARETKNVEAEEQAIRRHVEAMHALSVKTRELKAAKAELDQETAATIGNIQSLREEFENTTTVTDELRTKFQQLFATPLDTESEKAKAQAIQEIDAALANVKTRFDGMGTAAQSASEQIQSMNQRYLALNAGLKDFNFFMTIAIEKIIRYRVAFRMLQKGLEALKNTFIFARDIEHQFAQIEKATIGAITDLRELEDAAFKMARTYGTSMKELTDIMFLWAQQGKAQSEIIKLTEATVLGMRAANLDAKMAAETLTSAQKIYNLTAEESISVFDKLLNVQRQFAVTTKDLADSIKLLGTTAEEFGISLNRLLGQITAIVQVTRRTGSQIANSLKTMFARFVQTDTIRAIQEIGVAIYDVEGNIRNLGDVLDELAARWGSLSSAQRLATARSIGGIRHYTNFLVLMDQYAVSLRAAVEAQTSWGYAVRAAEIELDTTANAMERMSAGWTEMLAKIGSAEFGFLGLGRGLADLVQGLNSLAQSSRAFSEVAAGALHLLGSIVVVKGAAVALAIVMKKVHTQNLPALADQFMIVGAQAKDTATAMENYGGALPFKQLAIMRKMTIEQQLALLAQAKGLKAGGVVSVAYGKEQLKLARSVDIATNSLQKQIVATTGADAAITGLALKTASATKVISAKAKVLGVFTALLGNIKTMAVMAAVAIGAWLIPKLLRKKETLEDISSVMKQSLSDMQEHAKTTAQLAFQALQAQINLKHFYEQLRNAEKGSADAAIAASLLHREIYRIAAIGDNVIPQLFSIDSLKAGQDLSKVMERMNNTTEKFARVAQHAHKEAARAVAEHQKEALLVLSAYDEMIDVLEAYDAARERASGAFTDPMDNKELKETLSILKESRQILESLERTHLDRQFLGPGDWERVRELRAVQDELRGINDEIVNLGVVPAFENMGEEAATLGRKLLELKHRFPEVFKDIEIDESVFRDLEKLPSEIMKAWAKEDFPEEFPWLRRIYDTAAGEAFRSVEQARELVRQVIADYMQSLAKLAEAMQREVQNTTNSLGMSAEETKRFFRTIAGEAAEGIVAFQNVGKTIEKDVIGALRSGEQTNIWELTLRGQEKALAQMEQMVDTAARRLEQERMAVKIEQEMERRREAQTREELSGYLERSRSLKEILGLGKDQIENARKAEEIRRGETSEMRDLQPILNEYVQVQAEVEKGAQRLAIAYNGITQETLHLIRGKLRAKDMDEEMIAIIEEMARKAAEDGQSRVAQAEEYYKVMRRIHAEDAASQRIIIARTRALAQGAKLQEETFKAMTAGIAPALGALQHLVQMLELGNEAIGIELDIQTMYYREQLNVANDILRVLGMNEKTIEGAADVALDYYNGLISIEDVYAHINSKIGEGTEEAQRAVTTLDNALQVSQARTEAERRTLEVQKAMANIVSVYNNKVDALVDKNNRLFDIQKDISAYHGDSLAVYDLEIKRIEEQIKLREKSVGMISSGVGAIMRVSKEQEKFIKQTEESLANSSELAKLYNELLEQNLRKNLEQLRPLLKSVEAMASGLADAFSSFARNLTTNTIAYFDEIARLSGEIEITEDYINALYSQRATILDETSKAYQDITEEIERAKKEQEELNEELKEALRFTTVLRDTFGSFMQDLGDMVLDIHTEQLRDALTRILTENSIGQQITEAFLTGSQLAAREYIKELDAWTKEQQGMIQNALIESSAKLTADLKAALDDSFETGGNYVYERIVDAFRDATPAPFHGPELPPGFVATPALTTMEAVPAKLDPLLDRQEGAFVDFAGRMTDLESPLEDIEKNTEDILKIPEGLNNLKAAVESSAMLIGNMLAASLAASMHGPHASRAGAIGASIGGTLLTSAAKKYAPALAGSIIGGAVIPVVGSLIGGVIGGLFANRPPKRKPPRKIPIYEENTHATRANTEAIRSLNTELQGLKHELINAPSRFSLAPSAAMRGYLTGGMGGGGESPAGGPSGGLSLNINVAGDLNQGAADRIIQEVSQAYNMQRRTGGVNSRKLRR